jgi:hypothetical protein
LIWIKKEGIRFADARLALEEVKMPAESILVSTGVCVMFLLFAFAVAWADHSTSRWLRDKALAKQTKGDVEQPRREAA